jgi:hypothetical protein
MVTRVFFLNELHPDSEDREYERWVRETDYPIARALPSIRSYEVFRLEGPLADGEVPYDYVEVVEVSDLDSYRHDLTTLSEDFKESWRGFVARSTAVHAARID